VKNDWMNNRPLFFLPPAIIGLIPLLTALYTSYLSITQGKPEEVLWVCNLSNFLLAAGLFARHAIAVRVATLWLIIGTPLWIWDNVERGIYLTFHAFVIHIISALIGIVAMYQLAWRPRIWGWALFYGLAIQVFTRFAAPPQLNINVASRVYEPLQPLFPHYYAYMVFNAVCFGITLWVLERLLDHVISRGGRMVSETK
jgi:hypothetical protein